MSTVPDRVRAALETAEVIYTEEAVEAAYGRMAEAIAARLADTNPVVLPVMLGGMVPAGRLLPRLRFPLRLDYIHATRYRGATHGGALRWLARPHSDLAGQVVLLIDDILDEGITLAAIAAHCREQGAREVYTAVLLDKEHNRKNGFAAEFVGLPVVDRYVFGCGMDYQGYGRNLPAVYALAEQAGGAGV
ncbi:MAG TPA: hypoxanthine-guanine phosphoribosyltransferase [Gammaproteobacteria bacterium]|nr:hypoxanthine-guanine phosphoribosyltransferase [Gammaproteobacteria bacterium]